MFVCDCKCVVCNLCNYSVKCLVLFLLVVGEIEVWRAYMNYLDLYSVKAVVQTPAQVACPTP